jgi:hypothetical protein
MLNPDLDPKELLTIAQVASECRASRFSVSRWLTVIARGARLGGIMVGGHWKIPRESLDAFLLELTSRALPTNAPAAADPANTPNGIRKRREAVRKQIEEARKRVEEATRRRRSPRRVVDEPPGADSKYPNGRKAFE